MLADLGLRQISPVTVPARSLSLPIAQHTAALGAPHRQRQASRPTVLGHAFQIARAVRVFLLDKRTP
jgi:hypothetical protein